MSLCTYFLHFTLSDSILEHMFSKDPSSHFGVQKQNLILVPLYFVIGAEVEFWHGYLKKGHIHIDAQKYHTTGLCSVAQCEHCLILQASLLFSQEQEARDLMREVSKFPSGFLP